MGNANANPSPIRRIVAHMDDTARSGDRLAFAGRVAAQFGSELSVLYATLPGYALVPWGPDGAAPAMELLVEADNERLGRARVLFDRVCGASGITASFAPCCEVPVETGFVQQALYADVMVLGQTDRRDPQSGWVPTGFESYVVGASGKPALVVPHTGHLPDQLATVAVAWKETRESARAVAAALPFLQRAGRVVVLAWDDDEAAARPGLARIAQYLRLHGVNAEGVYQGTEIPELGELMLSRCADIGADLLVMGCYGHSRAREWVLGGASRTILGSMTLPVLMAH
jgi:nucleotide-binding universal stress UspA family protein